MIVCRAITDSDFASSLLFLPVCSSSCPIVTGMPLTSLRAARELASFLRASREPQKQSVRPLIDGQRGQFGVRLAVNGLPSERREQLSMAMASRFSDGLVLPAPDEHELQMFGTANLPLAASAISAVSQFIGFCRQAGTSSEELAETSASVWATPVDADQLGGRTLPGGLRGRIAVRSERIAQRLFTAAAEAFDDAARQQSGDRRFQVTGVLSGLDRLSARQITAHAHDLCGHHPEIDGGELHLNVQCEQVGTPLGALFLCLRNCSQLLAAAPVAASFELHATPAA